jgi:hypothetical protein
MKNSMEIGKNTPSVIDDQQTACKAVFDAKAMFVNLEVLC